MPPGHPYFPAERQKSISFTKRLSDELSASVRNLAIATTSDIIAYRRGGHVAVGYVFQTAVVVGEGACSQRLENAREVGTGHEPD